LPYIWLRGIADDTGMPREQGALRLERLIGLGTTPTERLQDWLYSGSAQPFDWAMGLVHLSWFLLPEAITLYVLVFRWDLFPQLAALRLGVLYAGLIGFFMLPTEPPWMAAHVVRILEVVNGEPLKVDSNALAALPSLHVAMPAAIAMWLWCIRLPRWASVFTVFAAAMIFALVYLGEHYLVDALAGLVLAYLVMRLVVRFVPSGARSMSAAPTRSGSGAAR
jgi:membrane-associated phospholipid phosphatase